MLWKKVAVKLYSLRVTGDISFWFSLDKLSACMISDLVEPITFNIYNFHKVLWFWNATITTFLHLKTFMVSLQYLAHGNGSARVAQWRLLHGNLFMSWVSHFSALRYLTSLMCWQHFLKPSFCRKPEEIKIEIRSRKYVSTLED